MSPDRTANFFTLSNHEGTIRISYYPQRSGPIIQGQSGGPQLEYQGPEGHFFYPHAGPGRDHIDIQKDSALGAQITVILIPTVDADEVRLTLLLPPINLADHDALDFHTLAIKTTSYGLLLKEGTHLTYEVLHLQGNARQIMLAL